jgi:DNA-binding transcriptional regulator YdaS (Cro superfamily)
MTIIEYIQAHGLAQRIATACGISKRSVDQWGRVPANRVPIVAELTGWTHAQIRPDLFEHVARLVE